MSRIGRGVGERALHRQQGGGGRGARRRHLGRAPRGARARGERRAGREGRAGAGGGLPGAQADVRPSAVDVVVAEVGRCPAGSLPTRVSGLTTATIGDAPPVCHGCVWWQSMATRRPPSSGVDGEGRGGLGRMGLGLLRRRRPRPRLDAVRAGSLSRAPRRPRPPAVLRRRGGRDVCVPAGRRACVRREVALSLAAIGEARDKGARALEAFAYRYPTGESTHERFLVHRTVFRATSSRTSVLPSRCARKETSS